MKGLEKLRASGVVAVVRGAKAESILNIARALKAGGVTAIEITVDAPGAMEMIKQLTSGLGDEVWVGAGTVLDGETARLAILAGAEFIVSPSLHPDVITTCKRYGKIIIPGAMTPTEIVKAYELGGDVIKVFPAGVLGPQYIKDVRGPLGHIPLIPTGGVDLHNAADFIRAGCIAIGVGGSLISRKDVVEGNWESITKKARQFVETVRLARSER
ncbi:bifunctional 4-hydroxy-2-oxoglutarate aldolase/2-dehydro-3-deoxy-phosphogluconate aldolase [Desulfofundulus salinus]|uniref:Bifunctional 4-hydroxy-2-oxoglutarate aldolase/2-dehydro-3-deoxy-phosphogluconate aldolase n=1 Tax=Desulfofundulus salinus TaxID=2419843 RepID=A0A494WUE8_9FIRM|nr:bifunctional 4-hydroxy-2-oxoglutarate aldolase/2-dehydro-3-deoxy-phosphogluconate aldolase [Desulfofundulus salinum]RKO67028.1 bifunctional 4-hydroxy-2-oxoglutarate aldolase/2-dehydro-3-deoxy-phosphogluconate aldolase [Desulfofundulus salinum]